MTIQLERIRELREKAGPLATRGINIATAAASLLRLEKPLNQDLLNRAINCLAYDTTQIPPHCIAAPNGDRSRMHTYFQEKMGQIDHETGGERKTFNVINQLAHALTRGQLNSEQFSLNGAKQKSADEKSTMEASIRTKLTEVEKQYSITDIFIIPVSPNEFIESVVYGLDIEGQTNYRIMFHYNSDLKQVEELVGLLFSDGGTAGTYYYGRQTKDPSATISFCADVNRWMSEFSKTTLFKNFDTRYRQAGQVLAHIRLLIEQKRDEEKKEWKNITGADAWFLACLSSQLYDHLMAREHVSVSRNLAQSLFEQGYAEAMGWTKK